MRRIISLLVLVVVAGGGFGVWYYFIHDTSPAKLTPTIRVAAKNATASADGAYSSVAGADTVVRVRVDEKFGPLAHTAVIETKSVKGTLVLKGTQVAIATITADMTVLSSVDQQPPGVGLPVGNRIQFLAGAGLETDKFKTAEFKLTTPIVLATAPVKAVPITTEAIGDLTVHGVTTKVTIPINASWNGTIIDVQGSLPVLLKDFTITPPSLGFVEVGGKATLEFKIAFTKP